MSTKKKPSPDSIVWEIKRKTRRKFSAEEKIQIILEGLRGEQSISDRCRLKGIHAQHLLQVEQGVFGAGKQQLIGDLHSARSQFGHFLGYTVHLRKSRAHTIC